LQTKQILGNELNIEKKIVADQVVIEPYKRLKASTSD